MYFLFLCVFLVISWGDLGFCEGKIPKSPHEIAGIYTGHALSIHCLTHSFIVISTHHGLLQITRQPPPYGSCLDTPGYYQSGCQLQCESDYVYDKCGCRYFYMPGEKPGNCVSYLLGRFI